MWISATISWNLSFDFAVVFCIVMCNNLIHKGKKALSRVVNGMAFGIIYYFVKDTKFAT